MKIACLGWGSLIWNPGDLLIHRHWFEDGPILPIEYTRQSKDGRLTLVITNGVKEVRTLWSLMATENLNTAQTSLANREGICTKNISRDVAFVTSSSIEEDPMKIIIQDWANLLKLDAVIWTNLPSKFQDKQIGEIITLAEAITYIQGLDINVKNLVQEYICRTPKQIDTLFRREFERLWGWIFIE